MACCPSAFDRRWAPRSLARSPTRAGPALLPCIHPYQRVMPQKCIELPSNEKISLQSIKLYFKSHCPAFFWLVRFNTKVVVSRAYRYSYVGHACIFLPCRATLGVSFSTRLIPATHHRIAHLNIPRSPTALPPSLSFPAPRFVFTSSSARRQPSQIKWRSPRPSNVLSSTDSILFPSHPPIP